MPTLVEEAKAHHMRQLQATEEFLLPGEKNPHPEAGIRLYSVFSPFHKRL